MTAQQCVTQNINGMGGLPEIKTEHDWHHFLDRANLYRQTFSYCYKDLRSVTNPNNQFTGPDADADDYVNGTTVGFLATHAFHSPYFGERVSPFFKECLWNLNDRVSQSISSSGIMWRGAEWGLGTGVAADLGLLLITAGEYGGLSSALAVVGAGLFWGLAIAGGIALYAHHKHSNQIDAVVQEMGQTT